MPQMADIVIKKDNGTTDITYTAVVPSSGDTVAAIWKSQSVGTAPSHQPEFRLSSRDGDAGKKRRLRATFQYPMIATDSTTNLTSVVERASFSVDWVLPKGMNQVDLNEAISQFANLLASALIKSAAKAGYSCT